ncbi:MAG: tetratricopeptide repeat protein [Nocardioidaceae bacterium]
MTDRDRTPRGRADKSRRGDRRGSTSHEGRTAAQERYDGPPIPGDVTGKELDRYVTNQLKSLPEKLAARVSRHLVAAAQLLDSDPETAYQHTVAARARAARVAVVREASGEAAYAAEKFKDALAEFKAARRMSGSPLYLPMMADCERALGRPERALAVAKEKGVDQLDEAGRIELQIVEAGARRDLGDIAAALRTLDGPQLRSQTRSASAARLRYAYADTLLADGQVEPAREWFERAAGADSEGSTDAVDRVAALTGNRDSEDAPSTGEG